MVPVCLVSTPQNFMNSNVLAKLWAFSYMDFPKTSGGPMEPFQKSYQVAKLGG